MFENFYRLLITLILLGMCSLGAEENELTLADAIKQLSDADYQKRETASLYILKHAELEDLEKLSDHDDPEVRYRVNIAKQSIRSGITPDTSEEIVELVHEFQNAEPARKAQILVALKKQEAYLQIFALNSQLNDDPIYDNIKKTVNAMTYGAVQFHLNKDEQALALKILNFAEPAPENHRLWAFILRMQGTGEEKLTELIQKTEPTAVTKGRILALYRSEGKYEEALQWAKSLEEKSYLAGQALMAGDLETALEWWGEEFKVALPDKDYVKALLLRANGKADQLHDYRKLFTQNAKAGELSRLQSILQLTAIGELEDAYKLMTPDEQKNQTSYLSGRADYKTMLTIYGMTYGEGIPQAWMDKQKKENPDGWWYISNNPDTQLLATTLAELGDFDSLEKLFSVYWENSKKETERQYDTLLQLTRQGYKENVMRIINRLSDEDLNTLIKSLKRTDEISEYYYQICEKAFPDKSIPDRIQLVLAASTGEINRQNEVNDIEQLITSIEQDCLAHPNEKKREERLALLYNNFGNKEKVFQYVKASYLASPSVQMANQVLMQHLFFDEWDKAANHVLTYDNAELANPFALDLHKCAVLRRGGLKEEEQQLLAALEQKFLDTPARFHRITALYQEIGLYDEARQYMERGLALTNPDENNFIHWERFLHQGLSLYAKADDNRLAALCGEMLLIKSLSDISSSGMLTDSFASGRNFQILAKLRYQTDLCWIRHFAKTGDDTAARTLATQLTEQWIGNGILADDLYPLLRELDYQDILTKSLNESFDHYLALLVDYPNAHNLKNGAAWLASRSIMRIPEAENLINDALAEEPRNPAYLDTRAEVYFAQGDRKNALDYSLRAWQDSLLTQNDPIIKAQYYHFKNDPLPTQK